MNRRAAAAAALALIAAAPLLFIGLGRAPFDDPGEGMHAEIARELAESRDPWALTLNGVPYVDKPPLLYALVASAFVAAGPSEAAARTTPALAALAAVAATAWLGARLLGGCGGLIAGLALLTSVGFFAYGRYVRPETLLIASIMVGFALTLVGLAEERRLLVVAGLAAFGVAGLAKDPVAALAPPVVIGLALGLGRRARPVARWLPVVGVAACLVLGLAWWALAEARTPGFTWYTVVDNHLLNVARQRHFPDEDVPLSAAQFLVVAVLGAAPWTLAAGATVVALCRRCAWRDPRETPWIALALWAVAVLGITTLTPFRLPHYGLPAYPMVALLAARAWQRERPWLLAVHVALFVTLGLGAAAAWHGDGSLFVSHVMDATDVATRKSEVAGQAPPIPGWEDMRPLVGMTALVFLAGGVVAGFVLVVRPLRGRRGLAMVAVIATMLGVLPVVASALALVSTHRAVRSIAMEVARRAGPGDILVHEGPIENSGALEWYGGRRAVILDGRRSVLGFGATLPATADTFWDRERFGRVWGSRTRVWLVTTRPPETSVISALGGGPSVMAAGGRQLYVNHGE